MENWILEAAQLTIAALVVVYIFYTLAFSAREEERRQQAETNRRTFERREIERYDRRRGNQGPPQGLKERRLMIRRGRG